MGRIRGVVVIMLAIDLLLQGRRGAHGMTMKQAAGWSILWVTLSCSLTPPSGGIWRKPKAAPLPIRRRWPSSPAI
jgi:hypothetical protein